MQRLKPRGWREARRELDKLRTVKVRPRLPLQTGMYKNRSKNRYYLYEGILYLKVNGKIPARHARVFSK